MSNEMRTLINLCENDLDLEDFMRLNLAAGKPSYKLTKNITQQYLWSDYDYLTEEKEIGIFLSLDLAIKHVDTIKRENPDRNWEILSRADTIFDDAHKVYVARGRRDYTNSDGELDNELNDDLVTVNTITLVITEEWFTNMSWTPLLKKYLDD